MSFLCDSIYFITVFLFGSAASVCFTGVPFNRKNILSVCFLCPRRNTSDHFFRSLRTGDLQRAVSGRCTSSVGAFSLADIQLLMDHFNRQCLNCLYVLPDSSLVRTGRSLIF